MRDRERFKLHFGPYTTPRFRRGRRVVDEWRGEVTFAGLSNGRIPWPIGILGGNKTLVVYAGLARAIRRESVQAVAYWFGVSPQTVTKWRRKLGIADGKPPGTTRLRRAYFDEPWAHAARAKAHAKARDPVRREKIAASRRGKKRPPGVIAALRRANLGRQASDATRQKMREAHRLRGTRPPWLNPAWTAAEDEFVRTLSVSEAAARTGRTIAAIVSRRTILRKMGVPIRDGRRRA